jgi:hypothetical protein
MHCRGCHSRWSQFELAQKELFLKHYRSRLPFRLYARSCSRNFFSWASESSFNLPRSRLVGAKIGSQSNPGFGQHPSLVTKQAGMNAGMRPRRLSWKPRAARRLQ